MTAFQAVDSGSIPGTRTENQKTPHVWSFLVFCREKLFDRVFQRFGSAEFVLIGEFATIGS